jgi:MFS transporter, AAHS family, 3-hydroxyphenylpropionic acid transporter
MSATIRPILGAGPSSPASVPALEASASTTADGVAVAAMAFAVMLAGSVQIPAIRPLFADRLHASDSAMHAFASVNMLGAIVGAPLFGRLADRTGRHALLAAALAFADALLLLACLAPTNVAAVLALRTAEGAAHVGALSVVLGALGRNRRANGATPGAAAGAVMFAVAIGPAAGGALLASHVCAPFEAASALLAGVGLTALAFPATLGDFSHRTGLPAPRVFAVLRSPLVLVPSALALVERFTIGCFVVTFSLYAHRVRHLTDTQVSMHYSYLLLPFALATYPLARRTERWSRAALIRAGGVLYGVTFMLFGWTDGLGLAAALAVAGLASAMVYGPSLSCVASAGQATAMAIFHAAGCFGMMLGPAVAGITVSLVAGAGASYGSRYACVFVLAGLVQLATLWLLRSRLAGLRALDARGPTVAMSRAGAIWTLGSEGPRR